MKNISQFCTATLLATACFTITANAQTVLSLNLSDSGQNNVLPLSGLAGAPGVRTDNWNNVPVPNTVTGADGLIYDDGSAVPNDFSFAINSTNTFNAGSGDSNDALMYSGNFLLRNGSANYNTTASIDLANIPYANYDIYVYAYNNGTDTGGSVNVGSETYFLSEANAASNDGTGYVIATSTTYNPLDPSTVAGANYVVFSGLTGASKTINFETLDMGSANLRFRVAGVQVVQVPEPHTYALIIGLVGLSIVARRRAKQA